MTLPPRCDLCGTPLTPWDDTEDTACNIRIGGCGNIVPTWEHLGPDQRRIRIAQQAKWEQIHGAPEIDVRKDVL